MAAPKPSPRDYAILGLQPGAPREVCAINHERLTMMWDPRHRPPDEQDTWITVQNMLDESLALIHDCQAEWARGTV